MIARDMIARHIIAAHKYRLTSPPLQSMNVLKSFMKPEDDDDDIFQSKMDPDEKLQLIQFTEDEFNEYYDRLRRELMYELHDFLYDTVLEDVYQYVAIELAVWQGR